MRMPNVLYTGPTMSNYYQNYKNITEFKVSVLARGKMRELQGDVPIPINAFIETIQMFVILSQSDWEDIAIHDGISFGRLG